MDAVRGDALPQVAVNENGGILRNLSQTAVFVEAGGNHIMKMTAALLAMLALSAATPVMAQRGATRHAKQSARIHEGVQSGDLTRAEAAKLRSKQAASRAQLQRDRVDGGGLTPAERRKTERRQDRLSRDIYRQKSDGQTRLR
jgi:Skp family chaperone for outer membrane proteins